MNLKQRFFLLILIWCGMGLGVLSIPHSARAEQHTLTVTWDDPFPSKTGLVRAVADGGIWRFTLQLEGVTMSDGPHWSYPGKGASGADPDWGLWNEDGLNLTWSAANTGLSFRVSVSGRIRPIGSGSGPLVEKDFEATWEGEVRDPRHWQVEPDWYVGDIETEHRVVLPGSSILLWMSAFDEDHWETVSDEGDESDELTYTWSVKPASGTGPAGDLVEWSGDGSEVYWNTPEEPGWYTITCVVDDEGEVVEPDTGDRDDGEWEVSIDILVVDVQLSPNPLRLDVAETGTVTATVRPLDAPVTFEIRNSAVATLAGSAPTLTITGIAEGSTTIIAKVEDVEVARSTVVVGDGDDDGGDDDDDDDGDDDGGGPGGPILPCAISLNADQVKRNSAHLFWSRCRDDDFTSYKLYRSTEESFTPSEATHIDRGALETQQSKTNYEDTGLAAATTYYYVLVTAHNGESTESRTSFTTPDANTPELSFEGLARACAGGVAVDGVHDFTVIGTLRDEGGQIMANTPLTFSFEGNKGELKRARYIPDTAKDQEEVPDSDQEEMTAITDAEGKVSIKVLSSDIISNDIKIVAKWTNAQQEEKQVGDKICDFAKMISLRRFGMEDFSEDEDKGWKYIKGILTQPNEITTLKIYLKHQINPNIPIDTTYFNPDGTLRAQLNDNGNWKFVNGHTVRIGISEVLPQDGEQISGATIDYATLINANDEPVEFIDVVTTIDGAAQVRVKAGPEVNRALEVVLDANNRTQW